jgi:hypothetical protein
MSFDSTLQSDFTGHFPSGQCNSVSRKATAFLLMNGLLDQRLIDVLLTMQIVSLPHDGL